MSKNKVSLDIEKVLYGEQIESHSSQFTNTRHHVLEVNIDQKRIRMRDDPNLENILSFAGSLEALFSYLQSLKQRDFESQEQLDKASELEARIVRLQSNFELIREFWEHFKFNVTSRRIHQLSLGQHNPELYLQRVLVKVLIATHDYLRMTYQGMRYYFRQGRMRRHTGLMGDLYSSKKSREQFEKQRGITSEEVESEEYEEEGEGDD